MSPSVNQSLTLPDFTVSYVYRYRAFVDHGMSCFLKGKTNSFQIVIAKCIFPKCIIILKYKSQVNSCKLEVLYNGVRHYFASPVCSVYNICGHPSEIVTIRSWHGGETDKVDISKQPILSEDKK